MVGEVFLASPRPRINAVRAGELARHESRHVDQWALCSIVGGIALLPAAYLVDETLYPNSENHFEQSAGLDAGGYAPAPFPAWSTPVGSGPLADGRARAGASARPLGLPHPPAATQHP